MKLHHSLLELASLVGGEAEVADVVRAVLLWLVVAQFGLDSVGAQQGVGDERARQATGQDVVPQLQAQVVPDQTQRRCHEKRLEDGRACLTCYLPSSSIKYVG